MHRPKTKNIIIFTVLLLFLMTWSYLMYVVGAERIVDVIGVHNSYGILFLISAFGGLSAVTSVSFYSATLTLAAAGLNPFIIALVGGIGLSTGDSFFYYLGCKGKDILPARAQKRVDQVERWLLKRRRHLIPYFVLIYATIVPLPNDIMMIALALTKTAYLRILPPLMAGNTIFTFLVATLGISFF